MAMDAEDVDVEDSPMQAVLVETGRFMPANELMDALPKQLDSDGNTIWDASDGQWTLRFYMESETETLRSMLCLPTGGNWQAVGFLDGPCQLVRVRDGHADVDFPVLISGVGGGANRKVFRVNYDDLAYDEIHPSPDRAMPIFKSLFAYGVAVDDCIPPVVWRYLGKRAVTRLELENMDSVFAKEIEYWPAAKSSFVSVYPRVSPPTPSLGELTLMEKIEVLWVDSALSIPGYPKLCQTVADRLCLFCEAEYQAKLFRIESERVGRLPKEYEWREVVSQDVKIIAASMEASCPSPTC